MAEKMQKDPNTLDETVTQCLGALAEVLTMDNRLQFAGRVMDYDTDTDEVRVELHRGAETPQGIIHNTPVKLQVRMRNQTGTLVMLYGNVMVCARDFWRIKVISSVACVDNRRAFRQKVRAEGQIAWGEQNRQVCSLEDISLVGVAFCAKAELEVGDRVTVMIPQLVKNGACYKIDCTVAVKRNVAEEGLAPRWRYGCSFDKLEARAEDMLCKDIFALQAQSMNRE